MAQEADDLEVVDTEPVADAGAVDMEEGDGGGILSQSELDALLAAASEEAGGLPEEWDTAPDSAPDVEPVRPAVVELPSFDTPALASGAGKDYGAGGMGRVRDIPLEVAVELGRTRLLIKDILELGAGSIIELDKIAGEPVDLFANGLLVARGEVIVIDDNFGVRVTEVITAAERRQMHDAEADAIAA